MPDFAEYADALATHLEAIANGGDVATEIDALLGRDEALGRLGSMLSNRAGRGAQDVERIRAGLERIATDAASLRAGSGDQQDLVYAAENAQVSLSNLHIAIDSNVARGGFASTGKWLIESLASSGAVQLMQQITDDLTAVLTCDWTAAYHGKVVQDAIAAALALELPEEVRPGHDLDPSELDGLMAEVTDAFAAMATVVVGDHGDGSVRSAQWMGLELVGGDPAAGGAAAAAEHAGAAEAAEAAGPAQLDLQTLDWQPVHDANQSVCKKAGSSDTLDFVAFDFLVLIGNEHDSGLRAQVEAQPTAYRGTVRVKSARIGAGSMVVTGVPGAQQSNVSWAIEQFSKKDVEFR